MKIDGIDPLVMDRIKDTAKPVVKEAEKAQPHGGVRHREKAGAGRPAAVERESLSNELDEGLRKLNDTAEAFNLSLRFHLHRDSDRWMVQVVDMRDNEVIREIPPEKVLNMVAQIQNLIGVLLDERR
ncbi:MAG: flagellar protein FlaG [Bacillota bacterium]